MITPEQTVDVVQMSVNRRCRSQKNRSSAFLRRSEPCLVIYRQDRPGYVRQVSQVFSMDLFSKSESRIVEHLNAAIDKMIAKLESVDEIPTFTPFQLNDDNPQPDHIISK